MLTSCCVWVQTLIGPSYPSSSIVLRYCDLPDWPDIKPLMIISYVSMPRVDLHLQLLYIQALSMATFELRPGLRRLTQTSEVRYLMEQCDWPAYRTVRTSC